MKKIKTITILILIIVMFNTLAVNASGSFPEKEDEEIKYYRVWDGHYFRSGGINKRDGKKAETEEEIAALEADIQDEYVLVNGKDKEIPDEEYELLVKNKKYLSVGTWITEDNEYYHTFYRVYIFKPVYNDIIFQLKNYNLVNQQTMMTETASTIVINDAEWYHKKRVGTIQNIYNDNIPSYYDTGFLLIESPVDVCLTFLYQSGNYYNRMYVKANEPFLIEVMTGAYTLKDINNKELEWGEDAIDHHNNTFVSKTHTKENPKILSLSKVVKKYNLPSLEEIDEKPDYSWENRHNIVPEDINENEVEVKTKPKPVAKKDTRWIWIIVFVSLFSAVVIISTYVYKKAKAKYSNY